jgi:hypothetical protein
MAATEAAIGAGTWMKRGGVTATGFADIGVEITSIGVPGVARDAPEATHMTSPDKYREFIAGLMDAGEVPLEYNFVPALTDPMIACVEAGKVFYQIGNADWPVIFQFQAICSAPERAVPLDDKMTGSASFRISGKPTLEEA